MSEWFPVIGYEGRLEITRDGRVRSCDRIVRSRYNSTRRMKGKELRPFLLNGGYPAIQIRRGARRKNILVHRMLAEAFIPNPEGKPFINHIDGNKANNSLSNLEWVTHQENIQHAFRAGLMPQCNLGSGEDSPAAKLTWPDVERIRAMLLAGVTHAKIATHFRVKKGAIGCIARNETWRADV